MKKNMREGPEAQQSEISHETPVDSEGQSKKEELAEIRSRLRAHIPQEEFEKLSSGELPLARGIDIKGTGKEQRLFISIAPSDPEYLTYQETLKDITAEQMSRAETEINNESERQWKSANKEYFQEVAELRARDLDPNALPFLERRIPFMEEKKAIIEEHLAKFKEIWVNHALDVINIHRASLQRKAAYEKFGRFLEETFSGLSGIQDFEERKIKQQRAIAIQLHCEELMELNALEIAIENAQ